jgi:hypothetical protein
MKSIYEVETITGETHKVLASSAWLAAGYIEDHNAKVIKVEMCDTDRMERIIDGLIPGGYLEI